MNLEIPDNNDAMLISIIKKMINNQSKHAITEVYGKPTKNECMGSGRANIFFDDLSRKKMIERVNEFKKMGIAYNYALNGIIPRARVSENRKMVIEELKWLENSPIRKATVANYELARMAEKYCPSVSLVVSFFAEVDNKEKVKQWAKLSNVKTIITASSTYRNLPLLKELVSVAKEYKVGIGVIANLGCMGDCSRKEEHAIMKDMASINKGSLHYAPCTFYCMKYLLETPEKFLQLPLIRPESLDHYKNIGIEIVKLVDRSQTTKWIKKIVEYYSSGSYRGNILDLTCNYTTIHKTRLSNAEVSKIKIKEVISAKKSVLDYREILPELLNVKIDHSFDFLSCNNTCNHCRGCKKIKSIKYDKKRRKLVLRQLKQLEEEYLFA